MIVPSSSIRSNTPYGYHTNIARASSTTSRSIWCSTGKGLKIKRSSIKPSTDGVCRAHRFNAYKSDPISNDAGLRYK
uniref:Uncharacterized protein n=1 Tax=Acrobeloides nanus TaxID=290746 RepID=A0A914D882_9BILA